MDRLPPELVQLLVEVVALKDDYASRESLKGLRLLNRAYNATATPVLFKTVGLWLSLQSLDHLTKISSHHSLRVSILYH